MSKKGGARFKSSRRSSTRKVRNVPSAFNHSVKLHSLRRSYSAYKKSQNRKSARRSTARAAALAAAQRNIDRMARRARGENSNEENAPHAKQASSAASSRAANRDMRALDRSLAAFGNLGEHHEFIKPSKPKRVTAKNKMTN
jgi:hypothetical protein